MRHKNHFDLPELIGIARIITVKTSTSISRYDPIGNSLLFNRSESIVLAFPSIFLKTPKILKTLKSNKSENRSIFGQTTSRFHRSGLPFIKSTATLVKLLLVWPRSDFLPENCITPHWKFDLLGFWFFLNSDFTDGYIRSHTVQINPNAVQILGSLT